MKNNTLSLTFAKSLILFFILIGSFINASAQIGGYSYPPDPIPTGAGSLDLTFGKNGISTIDFGRSDFAQSVVLQPDGKIIVVGSGQPLNPGGYKFSLVRLNTDGSLDSSFGSNGRVQTGFSDPYFGGSAIALTAALQNDGKIVVGGYIYFHNSPHHFALIRYNSDGSLDTSFGINGQLVDPALGYSAALSIVIQNDNKILATGYSVERNSSNVIVRYNEDGSLDNSFGVQGKVRQSTVLPYSMLLQPDGKIVIGGTGYSELKLSRNNVVTKYVFGLIRLNADGTVDNSFGTNGLIFTDFGRLQGSINSIALQSDGKIVAAGFTADIFPYQEHSTLVRYNSDGQIDTSFGDNGRVITRVSTTGDSIQSVKIQSDGKIVAAGYSNYPGIRKTEASLLRYDTDGSLDSSFGNAGIVITRVENQLNRAYSLAIQTDGKIVVVGEGHYKIQMGFNSSNSDFQVFRFNTDATNNSLKDNIADPNSFRFQ